MSDAIDSEGLIFTLTEEEQKRLDKVTLDLNVKEHGIGDAGIDRDSVNPSARLAIALERLVAFPKVIYRFLIQILESHQLVCVHKTIP